MKKVIISTSSFGNESQTPIEVLSSKGFTIIKNPFARKLTENELRNLLVEHKPLGVIAGVEQITAEVLRGSQDFLRVISRVGVGWDNIDHKVAAELNIKVYRTEGVLDQSVAELTLGFMLNALRKISLHDRQLRAGIWEKNMGALLLTKTVGIIGFGAIGQKVGRLCAAFGSKVLYSDICNIKSDCAICVSLEQLLERSDIITIHACGCNRIIGKDELSRCKNGVILINTARGGLIDESTLVNALESGKVGYACLDVFENEPYSGPLTEFDNVLLTAHIGSYAREARIKMEEMAVKNLLDGLAQPKEVA